MSTRSCCTSCEQSDLATIQKFGSSISKGPYTTMPSQADPILQNTAIHWVLAKEVYAAQNLRRPIIEGWKLQETSAPDMVIYVQEEFEAAIFSFRGTQTFSDILSDIQLSIPSPGTNGCAFDKVPPAVLVVSQFMQDNPNIKIQTTGHSLGGAVARCVGAALGLGVVTFNTAAPPSNPISEGPNQVHYHIVFDIISAWIPSVRIDKGIRPFNTGFSRFLQQIPIFREVLFVTGIKPMLKAHPIDMFSNDRMGIIMSAESENKLWVGWFAHLPLVLKNAFIKFTQTTQLETIK